MFRSLIILVCFLVLSLSVKASGNPVYEKVYFKNSLIAEGWMKDGLKHQYWKFYNFEGNIIKKGHFKDGQEEGYWFFYSEKGQKTKAGHFCQGLECEWWQYFNSEGELIEECEWSNGQRNGLALYYKDTELYKAAKFENGKLIKTWTDYLSFIKDNQ